MANVFDRLEYNFEPKGNQVITFGDDALRTMNSVPKFLDDWQYEALSTGDTTGYLKNPIQTISNSIITISTQIRNAAQPVSNLSVVASSANNLSTVVAPAYIAHGDRVSGVVEPNEDTSLLPHYETAMALGKSLTYVVNQSDGVDDNSAIMGSFTSILVEDDLTIMRDKITGYPTLIQNSIYTEEGTIIVEGESVTVTFYYSTLTPSQIAQIESDISEIVTFMNTRRTHDENFFAKSRLVMTDFNKLKLFKDMGQSERNLTQNFIGTEKLLSKLGN